MYTRRSRRTWASQVLLGGGLLPALIALGTPGVPAAAAPPVSDCPLRGYPVACDGAPVDRREVPVDAEARCHRCDGVAVGDHELR